MNTAHTLSRCRPSARPTAAIETDRWVFGSRESKLRQGTCKSSERFPVVITLVGILADSATSGLQFLLFAGLGAGHRQDVITARGRRRAVHGSNDGAGLRRRHRPGLARHARINVVAIAQTMLVAARPVMPATRHQARHRDHCRQTSQNVAHVSPSLQAKPPGRCGTMHEAESK
jgi:hypothetical protein